MPPGCDTSDRIRSLFAGGGYLYKNVQKNLYKILNTEYLYKPDTGHVINFCGDT